MGINCVRAFCPDLSPGTHDIVDNDVKKLRNITYLTQSQPNMNHVSTILASKDETEIKALAKYIAEALRVRKKKIDQPNYP